MSTPTMLVTWKTIIGLLGGEALLLIAVGWLTRTLITHWLSQDAEKYKQKLQSESNTEIERLRNSLHMVAVEHQIRFSKLQEKRADVIADLYKRLVIVFWESRQFAYGLGFQQQPKQTEEYNKAAAGLRAFMEFVETHRIYLPVPVCDFLDKYSEKLNRAVIAIGVYGGGSRNYGDARSSAEYKDAIEKAFKAFQEDIPSLRASLEMEFRKILGVESAREGA